MNGFEVLDGTRWTVNQFQVIGSSIEKWNVVYEEGTDELSIDDIYDTEVRFGVSDYSNADGTEKATITADVYNFGYLNKNHVCNLYIVAKGKKYRIRNVPFLGSGQFMRYGQTFITDPSSGSYYMIDIKSSYEITFTSMLHLNDDTLTNIQVISTLLSE